MRFEVPSRYRTLTRCTVRVARWDLSSVDLVDPRTGEHLATLLPPDKQKNADGRRRAIRWASAQTEPSAVGIARPLRELMSEYAATGLPPAYLPRHEIVEVHDEHDDEETRLTVVLVGHPERRPRMGMAALDALAQRIVVRANVRGIARDEMGADLAHRLKLAGSEQPLFETPTVEAIFQSSSELLRKANNLATTRSSPPPSLKAKIVTTEHVAAAPQEVS